jgi:hypothetical protein
VRAWPATPRTAAEIRERLVEAGRGLAAAHAVAARGSVATRGDLVRALVEAGEARDGFQTEGAGKLQERWIAEHAGR